MHLQLHNYYDKQVLEMPHDSRRNITVFIKHCKVCIPACWTSSIQDEEPSEEVGLLVEWGSQLLHLFHLGALGAKTAREESNCYQQERDCKMVRSTHGNIIAVKELKLTKNKHKCPHGTHHILQEMQSLGRHHTARCACPLISQQISNYPSNLRETILHYCTTEQDLRTGNLGHMEDKQHNNCATTLTFVPRSVIRGRREAIVIPFSPTVTETFRKVPPLPHFGQNILPTSWVTLEQA